MSQFFITSENTEDRFDVADTLEDAIRLAREVARGARAGDPVCIEHEGRNIRQFMLMANGRIAEEALV